MDQSLPMAKNSAELAVVTREQQELQSAYIIAKRFPRDEKTSFEKLRRCCADKDFAMAAYYAMDRSGKRAEDYDAGLKTPEGALRWDKTQNIKGVITGESVRAAEAIAQCWGNMHFGFMVLSNDGEYFDLKGFAIDLEANTRAEFFGHYASRIQRKVWKTGKDGRRYSETEWVTPNENQFSELSNSKGSKLYRNAILRSIPLYVKSEIKRECIKTLGFDPEGNAERKNGIAKLVNSFKFFGVTLDMLEKYAGAKLDTLDDESLDSLWALGVSIKRKETTAAEHFPDLKEKAQTPEPTKKAETAMVKPAEQLEKPKVTGAPAPAELHKDPACQKVIEHLLAEFPKLGVSAAMLTEYAKTPLSQAREESLEILLERLDQIKSGQVAVEEAFPAVKKD